MLDFDALRTPPHDGDVLVLPAAPTLRPLIAENRGRFARMPGGVLDTDWASLRRAARAAIGVTDDRPVILTGHQPEFMHAGVWAKYVVTHRLAEACGGHAINLVVDNDAAKTLTVRVPAAHRHGDSAGLAVHAVAFADRGVGRPYEFLPAVPPDRLAALRDEIADAMGGAYESSAMPAWLDGFAAADADFVEQSVRARRAVDTRFGVAVRDVRVSRVWGGALLADWLLRAPAFAAAYNRALATYRREQHVRSADRPIPDLQTTGDAVEVPVWAYGPEERRQRVFVRRSADRIELFAEDASIGVVSARDLADPTRAQAALTAARRKVLRPRALSLTLWARLLASDIFIHGIGGAKYDRITDQIIRDYYGVEPPAMICVSATLRMPLPYEPVSDAQLAAARRWIRDVQHQPDRWAADLPEAAGLLADRTAAIRRSDDLAQHEPARGAERRDAFERIHACNAALLALRPAILDEARDAVTALERRRKEGRVALDREYLFALAPRARLHALCDALPPTSAL